MVEPRGADFENERMNMDRSLLTKRVMIWLVMCLIVGTGGAAVSLLIDWPLPGSWAFFAVVAGVVGTICLNATEKA